MLANKSGNMHWGRNALPAKRGGLQILLQPERTIFPSEFTLSTVRCPDVMSCWSLTTMMLRFQVVVLCLWFFSVLGSAQAESWPTRTALQAPIANSINIPPVPTCTDSTASDHLFRRAEEAVDSVCGFVTSDARELCPHSPTTAGDHQYADYSPDYPVACNEGELCTSFKHERAWRCCQTASVSVSGFETYTVGSNCTYLGPTTCYDRNHTAACTGACLSTAPVWYVHIVNKKLGD